MKNKISVWSLLLTAMALVLLASCKEEYTTYSGPNYIMFADSLSVLPVMDNETFFDIPVVATCTSKEDRTVGIEVLNEKSNAVEGRHFSVEQNSVTIKAGERVANVRVKGYVKNLNVGDSLGVILHIVTDSKNEWDLYGTDTKVLFQKVCPFDIHAFEGWCLISSTYIMQYMQVIDKKLVRTVLDPKEENTIVFKDCFYDGYDIRMKLDTSDVLNPLLSFEDQVFASTIDAFGTIYGNGKIMMTQPANYVSYYSTCENFIWQYMTLYVENVGTVGTFVSAYQWISDEEAELLKRQGY